jgi:predicted AAA+ superfamily ATPase
MAKITASYLFERKIVDEIISGFSRTKKLLHIITGARQVGKTTAVMQIADKWSGPVVLASADLPLPYSVYYWRERGLEVDFVVETPKNLWAIEVKSGRSHNTKGLSKFCERYPEAQPLIIGQGGMSLEAFFRSSPVKDW